MKGKKVLASVLSVSVLSIYPLIGSFAKPIQNPALPTDEVLPISVPVNQASYLSFSGTVKEIEARRPAGMEGLKYVFVENEEGQEAYFVISPDTYILNEEELEVGAKITGFYDASKPMLMIYPPQYPVEVIAVNQDDNIKLDVFDQDLVSADGMLKLNISAETEIVAQDGTTYEEELSNKKLVVLFGSSTKSIPAQTNPIKVIVLQEDNDENSDGNLETPGKPFDDSETKHLGLIVNGKKIQAPNAYLNSQGTAMVPLRPIAESLNLKITWNKDLEQVTVDNNIILTIGQDAYIGSDSKVISLGTSPELKNGTTFVPLNFFSEVLREAAVSIER